MTMTLGKWLILTGGLLLAIGIISALLSNRYESKALGDTARLGGMALAAEEGTPLYQEKDAARQRADRLFYGSLVCTGIGILLQTIGSLL